MREVESVDWMLGMAPEVWRAVLFGFGRAGGRGVMAVGEMRTEG